MIAIFSAILFERDMTPLALERWDFSIALLDWGSSCKKYGYEYWVAISSKPFYLSTTTNGIWLSLNCFDNSIV